MKAHYFVATVALLAMLVWRWLSGCDCERRDLEGRVYIVTGGTDGLGLEVCKGLFQMGAHVVIPGRNRTKLESADLAILADLDTAPPSAKVTLEDMDLQSLGQVRAFVGAFKKRGLPLDGLILNAAAIPAIARPSADGMQEILQTNHVAHFALAQLLVEDLARTGEMRGEPSRIVSVSSLNHYFGSLNFSEIAEGRVMPAAEYEGIVAYAHTKLMNSVFAGEAQRRIDASDALRGKVLAVSLHPGAIVTSIADELRQAAPRIMRVHDALVNALGKTRTKGAQTTLYAAISPQVVSQKMGGKYLQDCALGRGHPLIDDEKVGSKLWEVSMQLALLAEGVGL